jgi:hypothetical protein
MLTRLVRMMRSAGIHVALAAVRQAVIADGQTVRTARAARTRPDLRTIDEAVKTLRGAI